MREVNAAWEVLRSPSDRAAYDDQLRATAPVGGSGLGRPGEVSGARGTTAAGRSAAAASFDGQLVDPQRLDARSTGPVRRRGRWIPVMIVGALVVGGIVLAIVMSANRTTKVDDPVVRTNHYEIGACVVVQPGQVIVVVPCDQPNSGRVAATTDYPRPCPTGTETVSVVDEQVSICLTPPS